MMAAPPIQLVYEGDGRFAPAGGWMARKADQHFVVGQSYALVEHRDRSIATHNHQFAWIADAWANLPEHHQHQPWAQTSEHLRKFALIRTGFCDTQTFPCGSRAEAERWARNLRPMDDYAVVTVEGTTVHRFAAQSQSVRAMGAKRFQESKTAILDYIASLLGVEASELAKAEAA